MQKKIFIIGASGMIGSALHKVFSRNSYEVTGGDVEPLGNDIGFVDITRPDTLEHTLRWTQPDVLILTAAQSNVDYCEEFPQETARVNIGGLQNVLEAIDREKTTLVYFSSDYIFDGADGPYAENDIPNPLCVYGRQKLMAEEIIKKHFPHYLIIRSTVVYGPEVRGKNFVLSLVSRIKEGERVKVPFDQIGSPTYSENLAQAIEELLRRGKEGSYHIAGPELLDRYSFARKVCRVFALPEEMLVKVRTPELGQKAKRPLRAGLQIEKVQKEISIELLGPDQGLQAMKKSIKSI